MQFFATIALLSSVVLATSEAQSALPNTLPELFSRIPTCADKCVAEAMPGLCPSVESYWCRCHNSVKGRLMSKSFDCAIEACGGMQQALEYQEATNSVCDDIMEVTIKSQKHIELRQVGSVSGSAGASVPAGSGSVRATGSTMRRGSSARGSGSGSGATVVATATATSTSLTAATGAASALTVPSSKSAFILGSGVAGLALISFFGMLI